MIEPAVERELDAELQVTTVQHDDTQEELFVLEVVPDYQPDHGGGVLADEGETANGDGWLLFVSSLSQNSFLSGLSVVLFLGQEYPIAVSDAIGSPAHHKDNEPFLSNMKCNSPGRLPRFGGLFELPLGENRERASSRGTVVFLGVFSFVQRHLRSRLKCLWLGHF